MPMNKLYELAHNYARRIGEASGSNINSLPLGPTGIGKFSISAPQENALRLALMEQNWFLPLITSRDVAQIRGQVIDVGNPGVFTGRDPDKRFSKDVGLSGNIYQLHPTDSCARLPWELMSDWIHSGTTDDEFIALVAEFTLRTFANDMMRVGFNGIKAAAKTSLEAYPNGEDINIGWHQIAKNFDKLHANPDTPEEDRIPAFTPRVLNPGAETLTLGENGQFKTLDALASWVISSTIPQQFQNEPDLVLLIGSDLIAAEQFRLFQAAGKPTENIAAQMLANTVTGRRVYVAPFLPGKRIVATTLANLHIYTQRGHQYRRAEHIQDRQGFENAWWRNQGYALGHPMMYGAADESAIKILAESDITAALEGGLIPDASGADDGGKSLDNTQI
ncbi:phage major capsid protein, P2 family [Yersinia pseudotuberculosis]|uniref:Phage major capsid protein, P2 family n=2 Tax=Yersinia pseudotuberculosis TaxID=633 RepID=A0A0H3B2A3_YERPY|nr:phage major capsid protein, P2 family [Yersinia pseudotuberculosis]AJJ57990.1 phage major capsid protein, P2 family [Yersinia pseudotuberculosis YPIII]AYW87000.1 phage major capsid protein, P2 family [Yersinia pseudotuberculosis]AYX01604.1 phage major capsid protein, P2 family [Yersinia pseudotuberculosis]AZA29358.1 phage major capsid protein, P2 family [Yersinia pseudotuberculosis]MBK1425889.1 phage major capsid protein, P2 family [Yersinia pseudotuberculosis]